MGQNQCVDMFLLPFDILMVNIHALQQLVRWCTNQFRKHRRVGSLRRKESKHVREHTQEEEEERRRREGGAVPLVKFYNDRINDAMVVLLTPELSS